MFSSLSALRGGLGGRVICYWALLFMKVEALLSVILRQIDDYSCYEAITCGDSRDLLLINKTSKNYFRKKTGLQVILQSLIL